MLYMRNIIAQENATFSIAIFTKNLILDVARGLESRTAYFKQTKSLRQIGALRHILCPVLVLSWLD